MLVVWLFIQLFGYLQVYRFICVKFGDCLEHPVQNLLPSSFSMYCVLRLSKQGRTWTKCEKRSFVDFSH